MPSLKTITAFQVWSGKTAGGPEEAPGLHPENESLLTPLLFNSHLINPQRQDVRMNNVE